jgi:hypothetical protein
MNAQYFCDVFFVNDFLLYIRWPTGEWSLLGYTLVR